MRDERFTIGKMLRARYGQPVAVEPGPALRLFGRRNEIHPRDVVACLHSSTEAAEAFTAANREHWHHDTLGPVVVDGGVLAVVDLRGALRAHGCEPTDPRLPDDHRPVST